MKQHSIFIRNSVVVVLILAVAIYRILAPGILPQWANITPIGAMAIFGGTYFKPTWKAYILPLAILFISDIGVNKMVLGTYSPFYSGMWAVYLSFALIVALSTFHKSVSVISVMVLSLSAVLIHWLVSDIQPWLASVPADGVYYYTKDVAGFAKCLMMAIPFEVNFLIGTLFFNAVLFIVFELLKSKFSVLKDGTSLNIWTV